MLKERRQAAEIVAEHLFVSEAALDAAVTSVAKLAAAMPAARTDARLSAVIGQEAIQAVSDVLSALVTARGKLVESHHHLHETQSQIGLGAVAFGGGMDKGIGTKGRLSPLEVVAG